MIVLVLLTNGILGYVKKGDRYDSSHMGSLAGRVFLIEHSVFQSLRGLCFTKKAVLPLSYDAGDCYLQ